MREETKLVNPATVKEHPVTCLQQESCEIAKRVLLPDAKTL
jgi:hypothetical protein